MLTHPTIWLLYSDRYATLKVFTPVNLGWVLCWVSCHQNQLAHFDFLALTEPYCLESYFKIDLKMDV